MADSVRCAGSPRKSGGLLVKKAKAGRWEQQESKNAILSLYQYRSPKSQDERVMKREERGEDVPSQRC